MEAVMMPTNALTLVGLSDIKFKSSLEGEENEKTDPAHSEGIAMPPICKSEQWSL